MDTQMNFSNLMYEGKKTTRREKLLEDMERIVSFRELIALIEPFYYVKRSDGRGRPAIGIEKMLRMYLLQEWFSGKSVQDTVKGLSLPF